MIVGVVIQDDEPAIIAGELPGYGDLYLSRAGKMRSDISEPATSRPPAYSI
jgi:hypothetical protein